MFKTSILFAVPMVLAMLAGPFGFAVSNHAKPDESNLYLVVGFPETLDSIVASEQAREIGPYNAPVARIVYTTSEFHASLIHMGYWVFPATNLSDLCGITFGVQDS